MRSSSEPESDRLAKLARRKATGGDRHEEREPQRRHEEREPQQSTRQKHGVEQSTAPSRAAAARDDGSSCVRAFELQIVSSARDPKIFGLRRCGLAQQAPVPCPKRGTRRTEEMVVSMASTSYKQYIVVGQVQGVGVGVRCANIGNKYAIIRRFTR